MATSGNALSRFVAATILLFFAFGVFAEGPMPALKGFLRLQTSPARLLSDFTVIGGTGAAFLNAGFVGLLGILLLRLNKISLSGPTAAAIFTMLGFALFGKTVLNCIPIILGVSLSALIVGKRPREYVLIALFGTSLGPIISFVAFELGMPPFLAIPASFVIGTLIGIVIPPLAITMLHLHQGYCLYNVGLTAGFIGLFAASLPNAGGIDISVMTDWGARADPWLILAVPALGLLAVLMGLAAGPGRSWREFLAVQTLSGRLPSDFGELEGPGGALLNAGLLSLGYCGYVAAVGAPFNGPVIGGLMTVLGFGFFGKSLRNTLPVFLGLMAAALLFGKDLTESWVVLAFLFGTALAPLAGEFGVVVGMIAGFLHLVVVERTGAWHGGMSLYNNGFAGGLTATLIVSVLEWYRSNAKR